MEEKVSLPTKTKIAAWWMMILLPFPSAFISLYFFIHFIPSVYRMGGDEALSALGLVFLGTAILGSIFCFGNLVAGVCLLLKKKKIWKFSVGLILLCIIVLGIGGLLDLKGKIDTNDILFLFSILSLFLIPLILLLLDRKNFWKVAK
jgi:hypothetical protein